MLKKLNPNLTNNNPFHIVCVGASAGGLEALIALLKFLPKNINMSFVLVSHLEPQHKSALSEILSRETSLNIRQAKNNIKVEPAHIYVIPPNTFMAISHGKLKITARLKRADGRYLPIDFFMNSLAEDKHEKAIGVILSGTGSDGTLGIKAIKEKGGITFAQDEKTSRYFGMPESAIASGVVDFVLEPGLIAEKLIKISAHKMGSVSQKVSKTISEEEAFNEILVFLRGLTRVDFVHYKTTTVSRRIMRRLAMHKFESYGDYWQYLKKNPSEAKFLYKDILIPVTEFFRDAKTFNCLRRKVFPCIFKKRPAKDLIRIWVPACSTGEEVYSIAISLYEFLEDYKVKPQIQIFGTDVSEASLEKARSALYRADIAQHVSPERLRRFFVKTETGFKIAKHIRDICIFAKQDATNDPPLSNMDIVSCRNMLIYLDTFLQNKAFAMLHYALKPEGFLVLGTSESVAAVPDLFSVFDKQYKIYSKKINSRDKVLGYQLFTPRPKFGPDVLPIKVKRLGAIPKKWDVSHIENEELKTANEEIQSSNEELQSMNEELETSKEELQSTNEELLTLNEELQNKNSELSQLNSDLYNVLSSVNIPLVIVGNDLRITRFTPMVRKVMNLIQTDVGRPIGDIKLNIDIPNLEAMILDVIETMIPKESEVKDKEGRWYSMRIRPYRTLDNKIDGAVISMFDIDEIKRTQNEARDALDYSDAIIETIRESLLVLDESLRVISANESFYRMFMVQAPDIKGESLYKISGRQWDIPKLHELLGNILSKKAFFDNFEVVFNFSKVGQKNLLLSGRQIYLHGKGQRMILLVISDVTERKNTEEFLRQKEEQYRKQFDEATDAIFLADTKTGIILDCNIAATKLVEREKSEIVGMHQKFLHPSDNRAQKFTEKFKKHLKGEPSEVVEEKIITKSGQLRDVAIKASKIIFQDTEIMQGIFRDVTEQKRAEEFLRQKEEQYRKQFEEAIDPILLADPKTGIILDCNIAAELFFERDKSEFIGMHQSQLHAHKDMVGEVTRSFKRHTSEEKPAFILDKLLTKSGKVKDVIIRGSKIVLGEKEILQGFFHDVTEQKQMEDKLRQSVADLRLAQRIAGVASWSWDAKKDIVTWSEELYRITGRDPKHFVPTYAKLAQVYTPESWQTLSRAVEKALVDGTSYELELEIVRPDGEHRWTLAFGECVGNTTTDRPLGLFGVVFDITERKQMELAKKTLVIDVSHSLKTPLAVIEMALNMSKEGIKLNDSKRIGKGQVIAYENIARSRKYISRMLEAFTVDLRQINLEKKKKKVSLGKIVNNIIKEVKLIAQERGLKLRVGIPVNANMVKAGERELAVILENLIDNALKFTHKGSISITSRRKKEWIEVRVKDTGCGIEIHNKVKLFEMFSKCYTVVEGLGLGLFICKRLTDLFGGKINIESKGLGKGTEVILKLPC